MNTVRSYLHSFGATSVISGLAIQVVPTRMSRRKLCWENIIWGWTCFRFNVVHDYSWKNYVVGTLSIV
jgi:hypothetical protein